jgi:hypothetical protein
MYMLLTSLNRLLMKLSHYYITCKVFLCTLNILIPFRRWNPELIFFLFPIHLILVFMITGKRLGLNQTFKRAISCQSELSKPPSSLSAQSRTPNLQSQGQEVADGAAMNRCKSTRLAQSRFILF